MTQSTSYTARFTLDKVHYTECYTESSTLVHNKKTYFKANVLTVFGLFILFATPVNPYTAWFVIALGILETVSIYYHKPWWIMRQMLSKASNSEVTLTIDDEGITTESFHVNQRILWSEVTDVLETEFGLVVLFTIENGKSGKTISSRSYISKSCLPEGARAFIIKQSPTKKSPKKKPAKK